MNDRAAPGRRQNVRSVSPSAPQEEARGAVDSQIGRLLLNADLIKPEDIGRIVAAQQKENLRFGEMAIKLGLITQSALNQALASQFQLPFVPEGDSRFSPALYAAHRPGGPEAEALRTLRMQLVQRWLKDESKAVAVLGARAQTGVSTLIANLAIVFAQLGESTLVVDANFRDPKQHKFFGFDRSPAGLSEVLAGRASLKDVLKSAPPYEKLSVLCAGAPPPNPQELLGRVNFSYVVETAPALFDVVLIDAPPVLDHSDAQLVAMRTGASILVAQRQLTRTADIKRAKDQLLAVGTKVLGVALCD